MPNDPTILDGSPSFDTQPEDAAIYQQSEPTQPAPPVPTADINAMTVASEEVPSLVDFGREPSTGAWPDGWYAATVLPGYQSQSGHPWATEDQPSKEGSSRNMRVCFAVKNKAGLTRNYWASLNYRLFDFTPDRLKAIDAGRKHAVAQKWGRSWPGEWKDVQRSSIAVGQLGQFERALGFRLKLIPGTGLNVSIFPGHQVDVHLVENKEEGTPGYGFSEITEFAKAGEKKKDYK